MAEGKSWRKIFNFSKRDEATHQWWEAQENPSVSLQLLIREDIERNGYSDKLNSPVVQQPRRGRPPKVEDEPEEQFGYEIEPAPEVEQPSPPVPGPSRSIPASERPASPRTTRTAQKKNDQPQRKPAPESAKPEPEQKGENSPAKSDDILMNI